MINMLGNITGIEGSQLDMFYDEERTSIVNNWNQVFTISQEALFHNLLLQCGRPPAWPPFNPTSNTIVTIPQTDDWRNSCYKVIQQYYFTPKDVKVVYPFVFTVVVALYEAWLKDYFKEDKDNG